MDKPISKQSLFHLLIFNQPFVYSRFITLHPLKMKDIVPFQQYQEALTLRKDAVFQEKEIIKMSYLDFIKYACRNEKLARAYPIPMLPFYYDFIIALLQMACGENTKVRWEPSSLAIYIGGQEITPPVFDDLRKILIIQNDIDFDADEFMNRDTENALKKAREFEAKKNREKSDLEDYIDSLIISLKLTEQEVSNLTIRKFWRYIRRITKREEFLACRTGQMSGLVTLKEPLSYWMTSIDITDPYAHLKTDEAELRSKIT